MSFLNLWALWIAAAVIPALVILYFLKLRRREQSVASTLLWKKAVQDLQVNAPFQKLRRNLLLLLQLLVLALAIIALARPIIESAVADEARVVLLIDRSASMNTLEGGQSRLDLAKEQAVRQVKTFNRRGGGWSSIFSLAGADARTQVMVIAFAERAAIVSPFTTNTSELETLIRGIEPTDERTNIAEALQLAKAYMLPPTMLTPGMEGTPISVEAPARVVLISDGRIAQLENAVLEAGEMSWLPIGETRDNVGITAFRTQRSYETPENVEVFITVGNYGAESVATDVSLYVDGQIATVRRVTLDSGPATTQPATGPAVQGGNVASLALDLPLERAAVLEARLARSDALMADNSAFAIIPPPRKLRVLVVTEQNALLDLALGLLPLAEYPFIKPADWEANTGGRYGDAESSGFDVVVFDKVQPARLPPGNYLFLGAAPAVEGVSLGEATSLRSFIWWDEVHAVLRHVALEYVTVFQNRPLTVPREAEILAEGADGPMMARYARDGRNALLLSFALEQSDWRTKPSLPIFLYNAFRYLGGISADAEREVAHPGETVRVAAPPGRERVEIRGPDGRNGDAKVDSSGAAFFGGTSRVGVYRVTDGTPGRDAFAINLEDADESQVGPPETLRMEGSREVGKLEAIRTATPEIWRWFVGAALVLVLIEWWIYNRRVMV